MSASKVVDVYLGEGGTIEVFNTHTSGGELPVCLRICALSLFWIYYVAVGSIDDRNDWRDASRRERCHALFYGTAMHWFGIPSLAETLVVALSLGERCLVFKSKTS